MKKDAEKAKEIMKKIEHDESIGGASATRQGKIDFFEFMLSQARTEGYNEATAACYHGGMSLLDFFAAHAMTGLLSSIYANFSTENDDLAQLAYRVAELMLKERKNKQ